MESLHREPWNSFDGKIDVSAMDPDGQAKCVLAVMIRDDSLHGLRSKRVANAIGISPQRASQYLCKLEHQGLVRKERANHEKRASRWHLTEELRGKIHAD